MVRLLEYFTSSMWGRSSREDVLNASFRNVCLMHSGPHSSARIVRFTGLTDLNASKVSPSLHVLASSLRWLDGTWQPRYRIIRLSDFESSPSALCAERNKLASEVAVHATESSRYHLSNNAFQLQLLGRCKFDRAVSNHSAVISVEKRGDGDLHRLNRQRASSDRESSVSCSYNSETPVCMTGSRAMHDGKRAVCSTWMRASKFSDWSGE